MLNGIIDMTTIHLTEEEYNNPIRKPDGDLLSALRNNPTFIDIEHIKTLLACVPGEADGNHWFWVCRLENYSIKYILIEAACCYTGWDCQSHVNVELNQCVECLIDESSIIDNVERKNSKNIKIQLKRQVRGTQPYGIRDNVVNDFMEM